MLKKMKFALCRALFAGKKNDDLESLAISVLGDKYEDVSE